MWILLQGDSLKRGVYIPPVLCGAWALTSLCKNGTTIQLIFETLYISYTLFIPSLLVEGIIRIYQICTLYCKLFSVNTTYDI